MNWDRLENAWEQCQGTAKKSWERLTDKLGRVVAGTKVRAEEVQGGLDRPVLASCPRPATDSGMAGRIALVGLGAGLMYIFDPDRGRRRRALVRDQMIHAMNEIDDAIGALSRDLSNRAQGAWAFVRSLPARLTGEAVPDQVLAQRVRSKIGRVVSHPGSIGVAVHDGRVILSGPILAHEVDRLLAAVSRVPGVRGVEERLDRHERPNGISGLQGGRPRAGERFELCQAIWSPTTRLLVGSAGTALAAAGASRRGVTGLALGALGTALLVRAVANKPMSHWLGSEDDDVSREADMTIWAARERGEPGGGRGRRDVVGRTGVYPGSGPYPAGEAAMRTPATFVHGQRDAEGREESGGSEPIYFNRDTLLVGETAPPPTHEAPPMGPKPAGAKPERDKTL